MLKVNNLKVKYNNREIISDISFEIKKGEIVSIVGINGSGKSTLMKAISGLIEYDGEIFIDGKERKDFKNNREIAKKIGLMGQNTSIVFNYTVYETVKIGRYPHQNSSFSNIGVEENNIIEDVLCKLDLENLRNRRLSTLSGGQLQRVYLAKVFIQDPEILLLDEPTNNLDLKCQIELIDFIKSWANSKNKIVISVLHDLNLILGFSDRVILIEDGKIIGIDKTEKILKSKELETIYKMDVREYMIKKLKMWI